MYEYAGLMTAVEDREVGHREGGEPELEILHIQLLARRRVWVYSCTFDWCCRLVERQPPEQDQY
jgi:hypothetical protein